jgi:hypothetical protein
MFEPEQFVTDCRAAFAQDPTHIAVREVIARAVSDAAAVLKGLGEPKRAEIKELFHSNTLTILNVFWRRVKGTPNKIEAAGAKALSATDAEPLGADIIHSVINPIDKLTGAIHIYGGDFFAAERSEWDSLTLLEHRSDGERTRRVFEEANARYEASKDARAGSV